MPSATSGAARRAFHAPHAQRANHPSPITNRMDAAESTDSNPGVTLSGQGTSSRRSVRVHSAGIENSVAGNRSDSPFHAPPAACRSAGSKAHSAKNPAAIPTAAATRLIFGREFPWKRRWKQDHQHPQQEWCRHGRLLGQQRQPQANPAPDAFGCRLFSAAKKSVQEGQREEQAQHIGPKTRRMNRLG